MYRPRLKLEIFYPKGIICYIIGYIGYFQDIRLGCTRSVVFSEDYVYSKSRGKSRNTKYSDFDSFANDCTLNITTINIFYHSFV